MHAHLINRMAAKNWAMAMDGYWLCAYLTYPSEHKFDRIDMDALRWAARKRGQMTDQEGVFFIPFSFGTRGGEYVIIDKKIGK